MVGVEGFRFEIVLSLFDFELSVFGAEQGQFSDEFVVLFKLVRIQGH